MPQKHPILKGAFILTAAGLLTRFIGFFYRIFLSHTIGAEGLGLYHLIFPMQTLCMALAASGIQTAISRFVAAKSALKDTKAAGDMFLAGTGLSFLLSLIFSFFLRRNAFFLSEALLSEPRCAPLLVLLSYGLPLASLHTCIISYYYGRRETKVPAFLQLSEQLVRVGSTWIAFQIFTAKGLEITPVVAVIGMVASEAAVTCISLFFISEKLHAQRYSLKKLSAPFSHLPQLFSLSLPVTANRVLMTVLASAETILIPGQLKAFGLTSQEALSVYGVFTGMTLPLILFPSTITNSVSVMLLPSVAELQALGNREKIRRTAHTILKSCLALGALCTAGFFFLAPFLGSWLFHNEMVSAFLKPMAFICPFLYINTTTASILNGLGKTTACFAHNLISIFIRLCFVLLAIPQFGIQGYLWGVLLCEVTLTCLHCRALFRSL